MEKNTFPINLFTFFFLSIPSELLAVSVVGRVHNDHAMAWYMSSSFNIGVSGKRGLNTQK